MSRSSGSLLAAACSTSSAEAAYRLRGIDGLGIGDVKMLAMIGAFLGWRLTLVTLIFASFTGALVGVALLSSGRGGMKAALPFGTFLAVGRRGRGRGRLIRSSAGTVSLYR